MSFDAVVWNTVIFMISIATILTFILCTMMMLKLLLGIGGPHTQQRIQQRQIAPQPEIERHVAPAVRATKPPDQRSARKWESKQ